MRTRELLAMIESPTHVLSAPHRLDDEIRWVHVTDLPDPAPYLRGGELILTSALWYHTAADARLFARALASRGVHALGIALLAGALVPAGLAEACEEFDVLLMVMPDMPFMDVTEMIITRLMEERREGSVRAVSVGQELTSRLARGEGVAALTDVLQREVGAQCWVLRRDGRVSTDVAPPLAAVRALWTEGFGPSSRWRSISEVTLESGRRCTVVGTRSDREPSSTPPLAVLVYEAPLSDIRSHEATAVTLAERYLPLASEVQQARQHERRTACARILAELRAGAGSAGAIDEVLAANGFSHDEPLSVVAMDARGGGELSLDALEASVRLAGAREVAVATVGDQVVALVQGPQPTPTRFVQVVWEGLRTILGTPSAVGIAVPRLADHDLRGLLVEASQALLVAAMPGRPAPWATSTEASSHLLLLANAPADALASLRSTTLAPLLRYDDQHGTDLILTLSLFLDQSCSWQRTSELLHLHVNSLRYRIGRIEDLTGRDLTSMSDRVDLFLALRSRDL